MRFASFASPALRDPLELIVSSWSPDKAVKRARTAYEYVARILHLAHRRVPGGRGSGG
jgi:hypothetical protein